MNALKVVHMDEPAQRVGKLLKHCFRLKRSDVYTDMVRSFGRSAKRLPR